MARPTRSAHIPTRHGVSPSCVALPSDKTPAWRLLLDFLADRLTTVGRDGWHQRMARGEVLDDSAQALPPDAPFQPGARVYYFRHLADEPVVPFHEAVVFQDEHLLVADKPHFLPVTPAGRYVQQSLLVRLKNRLGLDTLSPIHRIDRETAGLVVFSLRPQDRAAYQALFRERAVTKTYEAIARFEEGRDWPTERRSRIVEEDGAFFRMTEAAGSPNSETCIHLLERRGAWARYALEPVTGKRHQLRVHMNALSLPIAGDQFYPRVLRGPDEAEDYANPLRLLAQAIRFTDPITGRERHFESQRALSWPD